MLERGVSDHVYPIMIDLSTGDSPRKMPFRFLSMLVDHEEFSTIIVDNWKHNTHKNKLVNIWFKLKHLKGKLKALNSQHFKGIVEKIEAARISPYRYSTPA